MHMIQTAPPTVPSVTIPTTSAEQDKAILRDHFDAIASCVYSLKDRWSDERDYEDFSDYVTSVRHFFAAYGMTVTKVTQNFKITFATGCVATFKANGTVTWGTSK